MASVVSDKHTLTIIIVLMYEMDFLKYIFYWPRKFSSTQLLVCDFWNTHLMKSNSLQPKNLDQWATQCPQKAGAALWSGRRAACARPNPNSSLGKHSLVWIATLDKDPSAAWGYVLVKVKIYMFVLLMECCFYRVKAFIL